MYNQHLVGVPLVHNFLFHPHTSYTVCSTNFVSLEGNNKSWSTEKVYFSMHCNVTKIITLKQHKPLKNKKICKITKDVCHLWKNASKAIAIQNRWVSQIQSNAL